MAKADYKKAIDIDPSEATPYNNVGNIYYRLKKFDKSILYLDKAIELRPNFANPFAIRSMVHIELGKLNEAQEDINKALAIDTKLSRSYYAQGRLFQMKKDYKKALESYEKFVTLGHFEKWLYSNGQFRLKQVKFYGVSLLRFKVNDN